MTAHAFDHVVRTAAGNVVTTLRCVRDEDTMHLEWRNAENDRLLLARIEGPGATRVLDAAGQDVPDTAPRGNDSAPPAIRLTGSSVVMRACEVAGHPAWIIDDYGNRERHFVFGCAAALFLHTHLGADGSLTITEKTRTHATLRTLCRARSGALLADRAVVQAGERLEHLARRCGTTADALRAANPTLPDAPAAGMQVCLA